MFHLPSVRWVLGVLVLAGIIAQLTFLFQIAMRPAPDKVRRSSNGLAPAPRARDRARPRNPRPLPHVPCSVFVRQAWARLDCRASQKGGKRTDSSRDCRWFEGELCTRDEPCTPCDLDRSCRTCTSDGSNANCFFTEGLGPYCKFPVADARNVPGVGEIDDRTGLRVEILPCTKCCTEP